MFFRKKDTPDPNNDDRRRVLRRSPKDREDFRVTLEPVQDGAMVGQLDGVVLLNLDSTLDRSLEGRLDDLCIQGANVRVSRDAVPYLHIDQVIAARIEHIKEGWSVTSPCMVRSIETTARFYVKVGIEFINSGDLYSQLDDQLGKYFNRRENDRIRVGAGNLGLRLSRKAMRLQASVHDLSEMGIGAWVDHVQAVKLGVGDTLQFRLKSREDNSFVQGRVQVARKESHGARDYVGLVFLGAEAEQENALLEHFIQSFLTQRLRWSDTA
ncbi:MAG: PilZ domain-containing protein [Planctomycetes bacterium]|nr:PilZ domain-containing protein [Planctomycetota bacterium]MCB9908865.1 PilZ domain-containing protein [Planctomycetota bacterium]HPF14072.1 PilZ domain-containing protein [Planctomycetota bacterium]